MRPSIEIVDRNHSGNPSCIFLVTDLAAEIFIVPSSRRFRFRKKNESLASPGIDRMESEQPSRSFYGARIRFLIRGDVLPDILRKHKVCPHEGDHADEQQGFHRRLLSAKSYILCWEKTEKSWCFRTGLRES